MNRSALRVSMLATTLVVGSSLSAFAQFPPPPGAPPAAGSAPSVEDRWPTSPPPRQAPTQAPSAKPAPAPRAPAAAPSADETATPPAATRKPVARASAPATAVACSGVFAKDSTHLKLATRYDSKNLIWGEVDGPEGSKLNASVLYPNDPRRRLEILWNDEAGRSDLQLIAINGQSQWTAPRGVRLGMPLAALEKANGRPFKLGGFGADGVASVTSWEDGALSKLPGGCKIGVKLRAPAAAASLAGEKELMSNAAELKAAKASVGEVLIGY